MAKEEENQTEIEKKVSKFQSQSCVGEKVK